MLKLTGTVKEVETIKGDPGCFGTFEMSGTKFEIQLARKRHSDVTEWLGTLLHELLHFWLKFVKRYGKVKFTDTEEHKFIEAVEACIAYWLDVQFNLRRKSLPGRKK